MDKPSLDDITKKYQALPLSPDQETWREIFSSIFSQFAKAEKPAWHDACYAADLDQVIAVARKRTPSFQCSRLPIYAAVIGQKRGTKDTYHQSRPPYPDMALESCVDAPSDLSPDVDSPQSLPSSSMFDTPRNPTFEGSPATSLSVSPTTDRYPTHMKGKLKCPNCSKEITASNLSRHTQYNCKTKTHLRCYVPTCGSDFSRPDGLTKHMDLVNKDKVSLRRQDTVNRRKVA